MDYLNWDFFFFPDSCGSLNWNSTIIASNFWTKMTSRLLTWVGWWQIGIKSWAGQGGIQGAGQPRQARLGLQRMRSLLLQLLFILQQRHQPLRLLPDSGALVVSVSIYVLEVLQCLNGVYVVFAGFDHTLRACFHQMLQQRQGLVDVAPVFAVIVEPLPDYSHDVGEGHHVEGQVWDFRHERDGWSPGVIGSGLSDLFLSVRVVVDHVFHLAADRWGLHDGGGVSRTAQVKRRQVKSLLLEKMSRSSRKKRFPTSVHNMWSCWRQTQIKTNKGHYFSTPDP